MKISMSLEFDTLDEATTFFTNTTGGKPKTTRGARVEPEAKVEPTAEVRETVPGTLVERTVVPPTIVADTVASSVDDEFSAPAHVATPLQFTVPETINDSALRAALSAKMDAAKLAGHADEVRAAINALIGQFGQAGKNQNSVPQDKRAAFLVEVGKIA